MIARPLRLTARNLSRDEAKLELGVQPEQVLIVTAADAPKYRPVAPPSFLDLVLPVLERHKNTLLFAAGPVSQGIWADAEVQTGSRVKALGRLPDVTLLQQAADVYLDSFPFSSLTSLLEAGGFGTPVVTYRGHPDECAVLGADTRGVDEHMRCPSDPASFQHELSRMITDTEWRSYLGASVQRAIVETHEGDGWRASVSSLYEAAAGLDPPTMIGVAKRGTGPLDVLVDLVMTETGYGQGVSGAVRDNLGLLPFSQRIAAWTRLARDSTSPSARHLVPEWLLTWLAPWWRLARRHWRSSNVGRRDHRGG